MKSYEEMRNEAVAAFSKKIRERVNFIAESAWPKLVVKFLGQLNEDIEAGRVLQVTTCEPLSMQMLRDFAEWAAPLRSLEMVEQIRSELIQVLVTNGIDPKIFKPEAEKSEQKS